jgi:pimeloyl-ACP methyl ester carboxylesterase
MPQEHIAELVRLLPDGQLVTVDAGHLVHEMRPEAFTHHLLTFLDA